MLLTTLLLALTLLSPNPPGKRKLRPPPRAEQVCTCRCDFDAQTNTLLCVWECR